MSVQARHPSGRVAATLIAVAVVSLAVVLMLTGHGNVRLSADGADTAPLWFFWVGPALGFAASLFIAGPTTQSTTSLPQDYSTRKVWHETAVLGVAAIAFAVLLPLPGRPPDDWWYLVLKLVLLLVIPVLVLRTDRRFFPRPTAPRRGGVRSLVGGAVAVVVTVAWLWLAPASVGAERSAPSWSVDLLIMVGIGFLLNSVLEEVFYRFWLQTRVERSLGAALAIVGGAVLWSAWHVAIQGQGDLWLDLLQVVARHFPMGILLGWLWWRHRTPVWPLLLHTLINLPV
ncbi:CPBP family intramembrane glutamic endopeptidase [Parenemella sanctibonifatiensis]|uniref:CPBP family intramembrane metalloprotease n=1 Tax=Parenemella sanctibonifatiensis TaxID=2016505 RepID=A0A255EJ50_9ACTN|nr:CPBP family intramembrane glutamic endopeptidase [Parenemella sanctibonifatiensis]OYN91524.1 CPBP family intramembrane metalloprotease [Parenemella sanctibonifatiensis]